MTDYLTSPKFLASENGKLLKTVMTTSSLKNETYKPALKMSLTEDVVILRETQGIASLKLHDVYTRIAPQLKLKVEQVRQRHEYLIKNNASIIKNPDGTVKKISIPGIKYRKIKREIDSKLIESIEVRADMLESMFERNVPATILAIVKVAAALSEEDRKILLWEIIKKNEEDSLNIMRNFLGDELFNPQGE